jgi:hypothetical protein
MNVDKFTSSAEMLSTATKSFTQESAMMKKLEIESYLDESRSSCDELTVLRSRVRRQMSPA